MESKRSKYDTNPLDPDYVKNTEEIRSSGENAPSTQEVRGATHEIGASQNEAARQNIYSEAPTRRYDTVSPDAPYQSIFAPPEYSQTVPYQPPVVPLRPQSVDQRPTSRSIPGIGLPEKWAMMLPYTPGYIGLIVSLLELFLVPRSEPRVRFHASQGLSLYMSIIVIDIVFGVVGAVAGSSVGGSLFDMAATVFLIVSMVRVWKGRPHYIAPIAELAQWLNRRIEPRNKS